MRPKEGSREAVESAHLPVNPQLDYLQLQACGGRPRISQPDFRPHAAAASAGEQVRPQKSRIVIELPERAERAELGERAEPAERAANRFSPSGDQRPAISPAVTIKTSDEGSAAADADGNLSPSDVGASPRPQVQVQVQPTKPMVSAPKLGVLDRMRRDRQKLAWVRKMFVVCLILAFIGLLTTIYLHFAGLDGGGSVIGVLEGSHRDGAIAGATNVYIRSEPDGDTMAMLPAGTRVRAIEDRNNWTRVKILKWEGAPPADAPDTGWVYRRFIKFD